MHDPHESVLRRVWAITHLFILLTSALWLKNLLLGSLQEVFPAVMLLCAIAALFNPSLWLFRLMMVAELVYAYSTLPDLPNHRYLVSFINIALLATTFQKKCFNPQSVWTISRIVIVVYFFAVFHKLNYDFFDPSVSCGMQFLQHVREIFPGVPAWNNAAIYGTVIIEAVLAVLLIYPSTWRIAAVGGILFHAGLSYDYYKMFINFSAVMSGALTIIAYSEATKSLFPGKKALGLGALTVLALFVGFAIDLVPPEIYSYALHSVFLLWNFILIRMLIASISLPVCRAHGIGFALVVLVFLNGVTPYVGIKNRGAFNMYSNLLISPDYSNHFLISRGMDLLHFGGNPPEGIAGKFFAFNPTGPSERDKCVW